jgi:hypothetical protein
LVVAGRDARRLPARTPALPEETEEPRNRGTEEPRNKRGVS